VEATGLLMYCEDPVAVHCHDRSYIVGDVTV